jgi:hypothetical protein
MIIPILFHWTEKNIAHIARHDVIPNEVEDMVFSHDYITRQTYNARVAIIGKTSAGRLLCVVMFPMKRTVSAETYYVVTARDADKKERALYEKERG